MDLARGYYCNNNCDVVCALSSKLHTRTYLHRKIYLVPCSIEFHGMIIQDALCHEKMTIVVQIQDIWKYNKQRYATRVRSADNLDHLPAPARFVDSPRPFKSGFKIADVLYNLAGHFGIFSLEVITFIPIVVLYHELKDR